MKVDASGLEVVVSYLASIRDIGWSFQCIVYIAVPLVALRTPEVRICSFSATPSSQLTLMNRILALDLDQEFP
jgi:hypothetical protein